MLFHGSKTPNLKALTPKPHIISPEKPVVFASSSPEYALSMIYGGGGKLAVSFHNNELFVDEIEPGALELLKQTGSLFELNEKDFIPSPEGLPREFISYKSVEILKETHYKDIFEELQRRGVYLIPYAEVPASMEKRGRDKNKPNIIHSKDRFIYGKS